MRHFRHCSRSNLRRVPAIHALGKAKSIDDILRNIMDNHRDIAARRVGLAS